MATWETADSHAPASNGTTDAWGSNGHADNADGGNAWGAADAPTPAENVDAIEENQPQLSKEEMFAKARNAGWTEQTAFDYDEYQRAANEAQEWRGAAPKYEWNDEYGDVGPPISELEKRLFGGEHIMRKGDHWKNLDIDVALESPKRYPPIRRFEDAGLHPVVLENIGLCNYEFPTPIQQYTIPAVMLGKDVVAIAQTGSGKTAAYLIPIVSRLMGKAKKLCGPKPNTLAEDYNPKRHFVRAEPLVVIVVPTRELAMQIFGEACRMCYRSMLRPCVAYGGFPMDKLRADLGKGCDILIATPGRLCDVMDKPDLLTMARVKYTVIDEADEMLQSDWNGDLTKILQGGDTNEDADHLFLMFSATFSKKERQLVRKYLAEDHVRITVGRAGSSHKNIRQNIVYVDQHRKRDACYDLLFQMKPGRVIIFCNAKDTVDHLDDFLYNRGMPTAAIHSGRSQRERENVLRAFRTGKCPILIATGVSARGWDIKDVLHVINYDLPSADRGGINEYIHRIGRTARIGHQGLATSFYNDRDEGMAQNLVNVLVECECEVPEFLSHLVPEDGKINFDDNSDDEAFDEEGGTGSGGDEGGVATGGAWGGEAPGGGVAFGAGRFAAFQPEPAATAGAGW